MNLIFSQIMLNHSGLLMNNMLMYILTNNYYPLKRRVQKWKWWLYGNSVTECMQLVL